ELREVRLPHRIAGKILLIMAADPTLELRTCLIRFDLDAGVHAANPHALLPPLLDFLNARSVAFYDFVIWPAVHVEDHRVRAVENLLILRPAIEHDVHMQVRRALRETLCEKLHAGIELVHPRRMRGFAGDEHELLPAV